MRGDSFPECPICKKDIASDAEQHNYCKLCGMAAEEDYCCPDCRKKFLITRGDWK
jgi:predicted amidophosphoribosyltransferase